MGLLMVASRSWIFPGCGRMKAGGEAGALLEGQPHLSPPEVASGEKNKTSYPSQHCQGSEAGSTGVSWGLRRESWGDCGDGSATTASSYGSGCIRALGAVGIPELCLSLSTLGQQWEKNDITVRAITANAHYKSPGPRGQPFPCTYLSPQSSTPNTCALVITPFHNWGRGSSETSPGPDSKVVPLNIMFLYWRERHRSCSLKSDWNRRQGVTVHLAVFPFAYTTSQEVQDQLWTGYIKAMYQRLFL